MGDYIALVCTNCRTMFGSTRASDRRAPAVRWALLIVAVAWGMYELILPRPKIFTDQADWVTEYIFALLAGPGLIFIAAWFIPGRVICPVCRAPALVSSGTPMGERLIAEEQARS